MRKQKTRAPVSGVRRKKPRMILYTFTGAACARSHGVKRYTAITLSKGQYVRFRIHAPDQHSCHKQGIV